ncbi:MAG: DUF887-domain-containing protein [Piptocephalis tieghemiana]|nr:MAG: DUF887-domain-containing protein [Piptocephalis tieghemiana]
MSLGLLTGPLGIPRLEESAFPFLTSFFGFSLLYLTLFRLSPQLVPRTYGALKPVQQINWNIHVVSMVHCAIALPIAFRLLARGALQDDRIFGYDRDVADSMAISLGYFIWDAIVSIRHIRSFGPEFCLHGVACSAIFLQGYQPFFMSFGPIFLLYEISTVFLNIHWFMDKCGLSDSLAQSLNGIILLLSFFFSRILYGTYQSVVVYVDLFRVRDQISTGLFWLLAFSNLLLMSLNFLWFSKMLSMVQRRFFSSDPPAKPIKAE